jgi:hypothetical protein
MCFLDPLRGRHPLAQISWGFHGNIPVEWDAAKKRGAPHLWLGSDPLTTENPMGSDEHVTILKKGWRPGIDGASQIPRYGLTSVVRILGIPTSLVPISKMRICATRTWSAPTISRGQTASRSGTPISSIFYFSTDFRMIGNLAQDNPTFE